MLSGSGCGDLEVFEDRVVEFDAGVPSHPVEWFGLLASPGLDAGVAVQLVLPGGVLGDVGDPQSIRRRPGELPDNQVGRGRDAGREVADLADWQAVPAGPTHQHRDGVVADLDNVAVQLFGADSVRPADAAEAGVHIVIRSQYAALTAQEQPAWEQHDTRVPAVSRCEKAARTNRKGDGEDRPAGLAPQTSDDSWDGAVGPSRHPGRSSDLYDDHADVDSDRLRRLGDAQFLGGRRRHRRTDARHLPRARLRGGSWDSG